MMSRTQIALDPELLSRARERAGQLGVSLAEYIRRLLVRDLGEHRPQQGRHDRQGGRRPASASGRHTVSLFVDTSAWYAAADVDDRSNARAKEILSAGDRLVTTDHVLDETWVLLRYRLHRQAAERFWEGLRGGASVIEPVGVADLEIAWSIGREHPDQDFSIVDRTSFAVMQRLGVRRVASFDRDFAVFRYGRDHRRAFEVIR
jgi:predicted nucleic acid-binding protein